MVASSRSQGQHLWIYPYLQNKRVVYQHLTQVSIIYTHTQKLYISLHIIMHVGTRTCYIHHKRGVTEVWHMAHFWVSYGRWTMTGSPM